MPNSHRPDTGAGHTVSRLLRLLTAVRAVHLAALGLKTFSIWCLAALLVRARFGWDVVHVVSAGSFLVFLLRDFPRRTLLLKRLELLRPDSEFRWTTLLELAGRNDQPPAETWGKLIRESNERLDRPTMLLSYPGFAFAFRSAAAVTAAALGLALIFPQAEPGALFLQEMLRVKVPTDPVVAGADVPIKVLSEGRLSGHRLNVRLADGAADADAVVMLGRSEDGLYEGVVRNVTTDLVLKAEADMPGGEILRSPETRIRVVYPPNLAFVSAVVTPPAYTKLPAEEIKTADGTFSVYPGSELDLRFESNVPLSDVTVQPVDGRDHAKAIWKNQEAQVAIKVRAPVKFDVRATSQSGLQSPSSPIQIDTLIDRPPSVSWTTPVKLDMEAPVEGLIPLRWQVEDDFGLSGFELEIITPSEGKRMAMPVPFLHQNRQDISYLLEITKFLAYAGSEVEVRAVASDNDAVYGPKAGKSDALRIRTPTVMDVYRRLTEQGTEVSRVMERLSGESTRLLKKMTAAARTMKSEGRMAWQMEQELVAMAESTLQAKQDAEKALAELGKRTETASNQNLLSRETLQKLSAIGSMMGQILKEDYVRAQRELQRAIGAVRMEEKERAMMSAKFNMEQFIDQVDRTHRMLSRLSDVMLQSEALKGLQDLAQRAQEALGSKNADRLKSLGQDAGKILPKLQELAKNPAFADLKKALAEGGSDLQKQFEKAAQTMSNSAASPQESQAAEEKLKKSLAALQSALQKGSEKSESAEKQNAAQKLSTLIDGVIFSMIRMQKSHDFFVNARTNRDDPDYSRHIRKSAAIEPILIHSIFEISAVAERLIIFDHRPIQLLRRAVETLKNIPDRDEDPGALAAILKLAYRQSATAAIQLLDMTQKLQRESGGKDKGMPAQDLSDLLQQLISAQMSLNSSTQQSMQMNLFGENLEQLAFQQELIRRSMEAEAGRFSELQDKLGRIDQLLQEMRKTEEELRKLGPTRDVQDRQQKILNKLMELQHSLSDRDEKEERFEAEPFFGKPSDTSVLRLDRLKIDEKQFLRGLPPEYRDAGRKYLRAILGAEPP